MKNADPTVTSQLNQLAETRLQLEAKRNEHTATYTAEETRLKEALRRETDPIDADIHEVNQKILELIESNRSTLIKDGRQSFETIAAIFRFHHWTTDFKVVNEAGVLEVGRKLSIVRKIADPPRTWRLNRNKFKKWLNQNPHYRPFFDNCIEKGLSTSR